MLRREDLEGPERHHLPTDPPRRPITVGPAVPCRVCRRPVQPVTAGPDGWTVDAAGSPTAGRIHRYDPPWDGRADPRT